METPAIPRTLVLLLGLVVLGVAPVPLASRGDAPPTQATPDSADQLLPVDCLLPGKIRKLGRQVTYLTPRQPLKTTALDCEIRGGEYVAYDRANYETALRVWKPQAEQGDARAQNYVGEIYERGLGIAPDYAEAARWYRRAAEQGYAPAQINLGQLLERGLGVPSDVPAAFEWYRKASGLAQVSLPYVAVPAKPPAAPPSPPAPDASAPELERLREELARARDELARARETQAKGSDAEAEARRPPAPPEPPPPAVEIPAPTIQLIDPQLSPSRGAELVRTAATSGERVIVGRVDAPGGLLLLSVNDTETPVAANGIFQSRVRILAPETPIAIVAVDRQGKREERKITLVPETPAPGAPPQTATPPVEAPAIPAVEFGSYHALVIGNDTYQHLRRLETARADADAVSQLLTRRYGFRVTTLHDATRYQILSALNKLRAELTEKDNLLLYYAGHGELDEANMRGNWLPVDAEPDSTANWISNTSLTDLLNAMAARHILVVADSCYSGTLTRSSLARLERGMTAEARLAWETKMAKGRSRTALTSGGLAPVLDGGGGGHSVFAKAFLKVLGSNRDVLEGQRLFSELSALVTWAAEAQRIEQLPEYAPIKFAGHESGDFFFVPGA